MTSDVVSPHDACGNGVVDVVTMGGRRTEPAQRGATTPLQIRLLGLFDAVVNGQLVEVGGPQQRAVLAILALEPGRTVPIERIVSRLWGEVAPSSALNTLQSYVSRLRTVLDPARPAGTASDLIVGQASGYLLAVDPEQVDAFVFQRLAAAGREALRIDDPAAAETILIEALALWRGPALTGVNGDRIAALAVRWEQERLNTIADLADAQLAVGHFDAAIAGLRDAVTHDPLHERLWNRLALALYRSGHQVDAMRALSDARNTLAEASGLIAGPELTTLEAQILAHDPALLPAVTAPALPAPRAGAPTAEGTPAAVAPGSTSAAAAVPAPGRARTPIGMVGRTEEWGRLTTRLDDLASGIGGTVLIDGEAGIGKTTLLNALATESRRRGWPVLWGRCHEDDLAPALWPWIEIVRQAGGSFDEIGARASLVEMSRLIADHLHLAGATPTVVVIDDVHWADEATIDLLTLAADSLASAPVLFAIAFRPPDFGSGSPLARGLGSLSRVARGHRVALAGMSSDDVARLIDGIAGRRPSSGEVETVHRRTGGNPLFVSELTRLTSCRADSGRPIEMGVDVPDLVRDVVRDRVSGLPDSAQTMLTVAAVLGERADLRVVARAGGVDVVGCAEALEPAAAARILLTGEAGDVRVAHAIVREAMLVELSDLRRARLHLAAADAIEHVFGADPDHAEPLAMHRWNARPLDEPERVASALIVAAKSARRNGALARANELVELSLEVADQCAPGESRSLPEIDAMEMLLAIETSRSFMTVGLADIAERIEELAVRRGSDAATQLARFTRWSDLNSTPIAAVEAIAADARRLAERSDDPYVEIFGRYMWAVQRCLSGQVDEACAQFELALAARDALGDAATHRAGLSVGGLAAYAFALSGDGDRAMRQIDDELRRNASLPVKPTVDAEGSFMGGLVGVALDDPGFVLQCTSDLVRTRPPEFPLWVPAAVVMHGWASATLRGDDLTEEMNRALAELEDGRLRVMLPMFRSLYGQTLLHFGEAEAAVVALRSARDQALHRGEVYWLDRINSLLAEAETRV